jgi:iron complex outermembrane receptor protein
LNLNVPPLTRSLILATAVSVCPVTTAAQSVPRISQDVVVTATVVPMPIESIGQSVTVLTREDLERLGVPSVVDALRLVPGVDVRARGPRDVQTDFSIRGATFGQSLILVDGIRINDSQSGHHNGDIPMAVAGLDRIEIVNGAGSTVHGADALGGTINVISRSDPHASAELATGQFGYAAAQGSFSGRVLPAFWTATGWLSRSGGFTFDRDFALGGAALRGPIRPGWTMDLRHQRKAFGANGFYGPSPSKEWTDQTLASTSWDRASGAWITGVRATWRNHGDHFRWDINRPGFAENRHRTNSASVAMNAGRSLPSLWPGSAGPARLTFGGGAGGDWVRSTNLGDRDYGHQHLFTELQLPLVSSTTVGLGARFDRYSAFGTSWSPAVSASSRFGAVKLRASARRAFRIPTFTELYYHDPANLGSPDLRAERGWSVDGGLDLTSAGWLVSVSPFARWDEDVIDWLRPSAADRWRSSNVRDVTTTGLEVAAERRWARGLLRLAYTGLSVEAPAIAMLSKYVLEYARHSYAVSAAAPLGGAARLAVNVDARQRFDGQRYALVAARLSRQFGRIGLFVDGTNLLDAEYHEVAGVEMPGRWVTFGLTLR